MPQHHTAAAQEHSSPASPGLVLSENHGTTAWCLTPTHRLDMPSPRRYLVASTSLPLTLSWGWNLALYLGMLLLLLLLLVLLLWLLLRQLRYSVGSRGPPSRSLSEICLGLRCQYF